MAGLQRYSLIVRLTLTALYDGKRSYWLKQAEKDAKFAVLHRPAFALSSLCHLRGLACAPELIAARLSTHRVELTG